MKNERYYLSIMSPEEKQVYKIIYYGLKNREYTIIVPVNVVASVVQEVYLRVLFDGPLFYYVNQTVIRMQGIPGNWVLMPEYLYTANEIKRIDSELRKVVAVVKSKADQFIDNPFRLEKCLHDSVVKSVAYDYDSLMKNDCFNAHSIIGAFLDRKAVCEGIAKAFKLLCNEYAMKCIVVVGKADPKCIFGDDTYHAWNIVKIGTDSYHVDATWDNFYHNGLSHISYDYFNVPTKDIYRDHHPIVQIPECNSSHLNYYECTKSYVSSMDDLISIVISKFTESSISFRIKQQSDEFHSEDEVKARTFIALLIAMKHYGYDRRFAFLYNDRMHIGKVIFEVPQKSFY